MLTALLTFLGGATARMLLGWLFEFATKWQDARNELARLRLQADVEKEAHARRIESVRLEHELGVKLIAVKSEAVIAERDADAFIEAVKNTGARTGIALIDAWNGGIRPLLASVCIALWIASLVQRSFVLDDWDRALMSLALGVFVGGRIQATGR